MNSSGHRANILSNSFTHVGIGIIEQGRHPAGGPTLCPANQCRQRVYPAAPDTDTGT